MAPSPHTLTASEAPPGGAGRPRGRRATWALGSALVLAGIGGLAAWGMTRPGAVSYYVTPSEVAVRGEKAYGPTLRVGGRVAPGSLVREGAAVRFTVTDGHHQVDVAYRGEVPDTLKERTDVVAEGTLVPGERPTLRATRVLAKCSSKFLPRSGPRGDPGAEPPG